MEFFKCVRDVLEEQQSEDDVLILGRVDVATQPIRSGPELGLEPEAVLVRGGPGDVLPA